jgi:hypothetical protein
MSNNGLISTAIRPTTRFKKYEYSNLTDYVFLTDSACNNTIKITEPNGYGVVLPSGSTLKNNSLILTHIAASESSEFKIYDTTGNTFLKYIPVGASMLCLCTDKVNNTWQFALLGSVELGLITNNGISLSGGTFSGGIFQVVRCTDTTGFVVTSSSYVAYVSPYTYVAGSGTLTLGTAASLSTWSVGALAGNLIRTDNTHAVYTYKNTANQPSLITFTHNGSTAAVTGYGNIHTVNFFTLESEMITSTVGLMSWITNPPSGSMYWYICPFGWNGTTVSSNPSIVIVETNPSQLSGHTSICKAGSGVAATNNINLKYITLNGTNAPTIVTTIALSGLIASQYVGLNSFDGSVFAMSYYDTSGYPLLRLYAMSGNSFSVLQNLNVNTVASTGTSGIAYYPSDVLFLSATRILVLYLDENKKICVKLVGLNTTTNTMWLISKTPITTTITTGYDIASGIRLKAISSTSFVITSGNGFNDVTMINSNVFTIS